MHRAEAKRDIELGANCTWFISAVIKVLIIGAQYLHGDIMRLLAENEVIQIRVSQMPDLNPRQRNFLTMAFRNPKRTFNIHDFMRLRDVVRATAHTDLFDLRDRDRRMGGR